MFYTFNQNNSGGSFIMNDNVAHFVIIEAESADAANTKAEDIGIYFDGCEKGWDCDCCGDRWSHAWKDEGEAEPLIYGRPVAEYECTWTPKDKAYAYVYYANGEKVPYFGKEKTNG